MAKVHSMTRKKEAEGGGTAWTGFGRVLMGGSVNDKGGTTVQRKEEMGLLTPPLFRSCNSLTGRFAAAGSVWLGSWKARAMCRPCRRRG